MITLNGQNREFSHCFQFCQKKVAWGEPASFLACPSSSSSDSVPCRWDRDSYVYVAIPVPLSKLQTHPHSSTPELSLGLFMGHVGRVNLGEILRKQAWAIWAGNHQFLSIQSVVQKDQDSRVGRIPSSLQSFPCMRRATG